MDRLLIKDTKKTLYEKREKAFASLDTKILNYKHYKKDQVFKVETEKGLLLVKLNNPSGRKIGLSNFSETIFNREAQLNCNLVKREFTFFRVPELESTDGKNYQIFEFINGGRPVDGQLIVDALLEFQFSQPVIKNNCWISLWLNDINRLVRNLIIAKKKRRISWAHFFKGLRICYKCCMKQNKLTFTVLKHGDFHLYNLLMGQDGKLVFLDLETAVFSQKWFFSDIVRISRNPEQFPYYEPDLIKYYFSKFKNEHPDKFDELHLESQFRIGFLIKFLRIVNHTTHEEIRQNSIKIINQILMDDQAYLAWYQNDFHLEEDNLALHK